MNSHRIYADCNATVPTTASHWLKLQETLLAADGNPSSQHAQGRAAKVLLEHARGEVARLLGADSGAIVFTSGATEANNLALQGVVGRWWSDRDRGQALPHVIMPATEHPSVAEVLEGLQKRGQCELEVVSVNAQGLIDRQDLLARLRPDTVLVALMVANNEVGTVVPDYVGLVSELKAKSPGVHVHCDLVQGPGKLDCAWLGASGVATASLSGHKFGSLKGVGALYLKPRTLLAPLMYGGGQERARRPGTENLPGIVSFGIACRELMQGPGDLSTVVIARDELLRGIRAIAGATIHGLPEEGLPNTVNFHVDSVSGDDLLINLDLAGVSASSGSACSSGSGRPSRVLKAMGYSDWVARNSVRLSLSQQVSLTDIHRILDILSTSVARARRPR